MNRLGDTLAFVIPADQLLLTRRGKTRMYTVGIVFEFYTVGRDGSAEELDRETGEEQITVGWTRRKDGG